MIFLGIQAVLSIATACAWLLHGKEVRVHVMSRWMQRILKHYNGITLYPLGVFVHPEAGVRVVDHELIHAAQQRETLGLFYIWYLVAYLVRRMMNDHRTAYRAISFEKEAYANDGTLFYYRKRPTWAFLKYIKKG